MVSLVSQPSVHSEHKGRPPKYPSSRFPSFVLSQNFSVWLYQNVKMLVSTSLNITLII